VRLLLDTCTFLWIVTGDDSLSEAAKEAFVDPANEVYLSVVSAWEIAVKTALGKLELAARPDRLVPEQRAAHQIESLPLTERAVLLLGRLPTPHRDPFDRMLVCQALDERLTILTPDQHISAYPVNVLW